MAFVLGVSHLFYEAKGKHGVWNFFRCLDLRYYSNLGQMMTAYFDLRWE